MCHRILLLIVALTACAPAPRSPTAIPPPRRAFAVTYREAGSAFAIVDAISMWWPEKNDAEYPAFWKERYGFDTATATQLEAWAGVRRRAWPAGETLEDDTILIGRTKAADRLAAIFYAEGELEVALTKARALIGPDADVLRATFALLKPKLDPLLAEARAFAAIAPKLQARLDDPKVGAFVAELARFYRVGELPPFTVELVWWPPIDATTAAVVGDTLLLRYSPSKDAAVASQDVDVALHEVSHFVSLRQPEAQKRALSAAFAQKCSPLPKPSPRLFEEPLAVAHQKMFLAQNDPTHFDRERTWYGDPWASISAKMIYDAVVDAHAHGRVLDERIAFAAGRSCRELSALSRQGR